VREIRELRRELLTAREFENEKREALLRARQQAVARGRRISAVKDETAALERRRS
jgi:hypothetical protein